MSNALALATSNISKYTSSIERLANEISTLETELLGVEKNDSRYGAIQKKLLTFKNTSGMMKEFLDFWKDLWKALVGFVKMFNEFFTMR